MRVEPKATPMKVCTRKDFERVNFVEKFDFYAQYGLDKGMLCVEFGEDAL